MKDDCEGKQPPKVLLSFRNFLGFRICGDEMFCEGWGCAVPFTFLIVGMQTSRERRDPARLETSVSLHEDHLKSDQLEAANCGEGYLRETFEFRGALIH